jgi:hypothetical protein
MRGWDFGNSGWGNAVYDNASVPYKRFLKVFQGLRLPYLPYPDSGKLEYAANRDRIFGFNFYRGAGVTQMSIYDAWIGEGFSPREVRAILGLKADAKTPEGKAAIRGTYIDSDNGPNLEDAGFYVPLF